MSKIMATIPKCDQTQTARAPQINFSECFRPIYIFSRIFGLLPYTIECDANDDIKNTRVKMFDFICFAIRVPLITSFLWFVYTNYNFHNTNVLITTNLLLETFLIVTVPVLQSIKIC